MKLAETLTRMDTLSEAELRQLLAAWHAVGARWRLIHDVLIAQLAQQHFLPRAAANKLPRLLKVAQVADYCQVDVTSVYEWINQNRLPTVRLGKQRGIRVQREALETFIKEKAKN